jgi:hypothetical protein
MIQFVNLTSACRNAGVVTPIVAATSPLARCNPVASVANAKELEKLIEAKSKGQEIVPKQEEEEPEETTDIIAALKASLKVKGKSSTSSTAAKAKGKIGIAVSK